MRPVTEDSSAVNVLGKQAAVFEKNKGIRTVGDLLELVPRKYLDPSRPTPFHDLHVGERASLVARVAEARTRPMPRNPRKQMLMATLVDGEGNRIGLTFFGAFPHVYRLLPGRVGVFYGEMSLYRNTWQLTHPEYEMLDDESPDAGSSDLFSHYIPVYSQTGKVSSPKIRSFVGLALDSLSEYREPLPAAVRLRRGLPRRDEALRLIHRPRLEDDYQAGLRRLRYDEAFVLQTILAQRRAATEQVEGTSRVAGADGLLAQFDARLPFELTAGQREIGELLEQELARPRPMHRLLQGEVGSGKTLIALRAMLAVVDAGGQAALLAPTEVLAAQHHRSITAMMGDLAEGGLLGGSAVGTHVALLTGGQNAKARRAALNDAVTGDAGIVVGTHALIQKHVEFRDLGLVVVDEQHRFGVEQRDALREKGSAPPHLLVMTATPIPRTVAMTVFGDMETSTLRELPKGRSPITTHVVRAERPSWVRRTWERVAEEVALGRQAYVVCPKIGAEDGNDEDGEAARGTARREAEADGWDDAYDDYDDGALFSRQGDSADGESGEVGDPAEGGAGADERPPPRELTGVYDLARVLADEPALAGLRIAVLHGRMDAETKEQTMLAFGAGDIDVLVATTVVEVGVDVPNASVMVVVDADRFGISQLHQLRGRVGRGAVPGLCLLMTEVLDSPAGERLSAVAGTTDGFELARLDLQLRREGNVLGARQSGRASAVRFLRMGNARDEQMIADAREDATAVVAADPALATHPVLAARVAARLDEEQAAYLERG